jgi:branched-chain amino acid transport system ATP-binding protein
MTVVEEQGSSSAGQTAAPVLATEGIGKTFGGFAALKDVTIQARSGQILGIIGPNGAGKKTLCQIISCKENPERGALK